MKTSPPLASTCIFVSLKYFLCIEESLYSNNEGEDEEAEPIMEHQRKHLDLGQNQETKDPNTSL